MSRVVFNRRILRLSHSYTQNASVGLLRYHLIALGRTIKKVMTKLAQLFQISIHVHPCRLKQQTTTNRFLKHLNRVLKGLYRDKDIAVLYVNSRQFCA